MVSLKKIRGYENLHILLWLLKDTCWVMLWDCLLYTSDAADERSSVDLGGRRIIKKKTKITLNRQMLKYKQPIT